MPSADVSERSPAPITTAHLDRLAELARVDRADRFERRPRWRVYGDRVLLVALCQGAALHFLDGRTGVKDLDVWTFYAAHRAGPFPPRWPLQHRDFGPSELGRHPDDVGFTGRHVHLIGRSLDVPLDVDPVQAVRHYLTGPRSTSPRKLARKTVIALDPPELRGVQVCRSPTDDAHSRNRPPSGWNGRPLSAHTRDALVGPPYRGAAGTRMPPAPLATARGRTDGKVGRGRGYRRSHGR